MLSSLWDYQPPPLRLQDDVLKQDLVEKEGAEYTAGLLKKIPQIWCLS